MSECAGESMDLGYFSMSTFELKNVPYLEKITVKIMHFQNF